MDEDVRSADLFTTVRDFVHTTLCSRDNLRADCFQLSHRSLQRAGQVCGWHFCLHGPRQLQLTAIWEMDSHTVLFYGSQGERFLTAAVPCAA
ncbi:hypothetical protein KOR34_22810 [Posidoniimonas corsicana]|uniref:Uncharacterized protein n=1 Tax=Posidoniimonas corsicana TaxID=1938618 RepID=A0A5C5VH67_9BACT|nr:hypothetical protein KOR34_22810 [Posidoniimonas corsicana]